MPDERPPRPHEPDPEHTSEHELVFRGDHDEDDAEAQQPAAGTSPAGEDEPSVRRDGPAFEYADEPTSASEPAEQPPPPSASAFTIEGFDEEHPPPKGHIFAEAPAEPPPQPYEIIGSRAVVGPPRSVKAPNLDYGVPDRPVSRATAPRRPPLYVRLMWGLMPLILFVVGYASVVLTQRGIGYAWDEAYYYEPAQKAADWLVEVLRGNGPFDRESIDEYWEDLSEHPSLQKFLAGLALRAFKDPQKHLRAMRLPSAVMFGAALGLLYMLARRAWGPVPGLVTAVIFATMPRIFGHAHLAGLETPLNCMMLLLIFCFLRGLDSRTWAVLTGVVFGLLLATKINAFFVPVPLVLWAHVYAHRRYTNNLFAMLTLGPIIFVLAWPWLWHDSAQRILGYLSFHAHHQLTRLYFMGRVWGAGGPNAPWFYPLNITAVTLPLTALALSLLGVLHTVIRAPRRPYAALYLLCALVMFGVACAPNIPKYDGVRLFLPVFPFLALLGGAGYTGLLNLYDRVSRWAGRDPESASGHKAKRILAAAVVVVVFLEGATACMRYHPYLLSYFNPLVGGLHGASQKGYEVTYWGEALNEPVLDQINRLPDGSSLKPLAIHPLCLEHYQYWGVIKPTLRIGGPPPYDFHLLLMRAGFFGRPEIELATGPYEKALWAFHDVPLIGLYRTGVEFERRWRAR